MRLPSSHNVLLPTFVISELGCYVRVAAVISQALRPDRCLHLSISLFSFFCSFHTGSSASFVQVRRSARRLGTVCASVIVGVFIANTLATKRWKVTLRLPPPTPTPHTPAACLSSQCPRVCACDARCRASIGRRVCPLFIIKAERLPLRVRPI